MYTLRKVVSFLTSKILCFLYDMVMFWKNTLWPYPLLILKCTILATKSSKFAIYGLQWTF